jgi:hypothetical protein
VTLRVPIPPSASDGWLYSDPTFLKIQLSGTFCAAEQAGNLPNLYALFACVGHPIP